MNAHPAILPLALNLILLSLAHAQEKITDRASEQSFEQQAIRADIISLHNRLKAIRQELAQNGAAPGDLAPIDQALGKLESVTDQKMQEVIASLKSAGEAADPAAVRTALLSAYADQAQVIAAMLSFSQDVRVPQTIMEMRGKTQSLLLRQTTILRETDALKTLALPKERWKEADRTTQAIVATSQEILGPEILALAEAIRQAAADSGNPDSRALASCASVAVRWNLPAETRTASQAVASAAWPSALASEEKLRSALQEILLAFQGAMTVEDNLQAAMQDVSELAEAQRELAGQPLDGQKRKQEALQDKAAVLEKSLLGLNLPAAEKTSAARELMEDAAKAMAKSNPEFASMQDKAADALDEARQELESQIAALPEMKTPLAPEQQLEALAQLHEEVMKQKEAADSLAADANAGASAAADLANDISATQKDALAVSPAAAQPLGSAASALGADGTPPSQNAAAASPQLAAAAAALQNEMDQVRGEMEAAVQLGAAAAALDTAILQTELGARSGQGEAANFEDAASRFGDASERLSDIQETGNLPGEAADALKEALAALAAAQAASEQGEEKGGQANAAAALGALAKAKEGMSKAGGLPQNGMAANGKPAPPSQSKGSGGKAAPPAPMPDKLFGSGADTQRNSGAVVGALKPAERAAIRQSAQESVPDEYTKLIRQYMKNLADEGPAK